jgi:hypothetical protein
MWLLDALKSKNEIINDELEDRSTRGQNPANTGVPSGTDHQLIDCWHFPDCTERYEQHEEF